MGKISSPEQLLNMLTILRQSILVKGRTWTAMPEFGIHNFSASIFFGLTLRSDMLLIYIEIAFCGPNSNESECPKRELLFATDCS